MLLLRNINLKLDFLHPGVRYRIIKLLCQILGFSQSDFEVEFYGYLYRGNLKNQIDFMVYFFGAYEIGILNYATKFLTKDSVVLDVGANIGHHTLFFSSQTKHVYAFEPYSAVRKKLELKIELNDITNITVVPVGLSNKKEELDYFEPPSSNLGSGSFVATHSVENQHQGLKLHLGIGDQVIEDLGIKNIDMIKIDVEGFEYFVLKGMEQTLHKHRPVIILEFNESTRSHCKAYSDFKKIFPTGYEFLKIKNQFKHVVTTESFCFETESSANIVCLPKR